jgi:ribosomal protein S18 acetylase RimI-like enzyme
MTDSYEIRVAIPADVDQIIDLLPQLADFDVPEKRDPLDLWHGDAEMVREIFKGAATASFLEVAVDGERVMGVIMVTMSEEMMSHAPSAHLEAIVVHPDARGKGLGQTLLDRSETVAKERGAESISLHVFANNQRARTLYQSSGFDQELVRAIKWF